jgi:Uma2 family endonuclease
MASVIFEERVEVPLGLAGLADFRLWARSAGFPETGRIDFLAGTIEVDMSPEDIFCHGVLKAELAAVLHRRIKARNLGLLLIDSTRVVCETAELSVEPDIVFVSHASLEAGRVRLVPKATGEPGRFVEIEGPPDLVVEIVSDTSVEKDTVRLPQAYHAAGVQEFWLCDARVRPPVFLIQRWTATGFLPVGGEPGRQRSESLDCSYRLDSRERLLGGQDFDLVEV